GRGPADGVVVAPNPDPSKTPPAVAESSQPRDTGADQVAGHLVLTADQEDSVIDKVVDDQPAHSAVAARDDQAFHIRSRQAAVEHNLEDSVIADGQSVGTGPGLAVAVEDYRVGNRRQGEEGLDEEGARAALIAGVGGGDVEANVIRSGRRAVGKRIGVR